MVGNGLTRDTVTAAAGYLARGFQPIPVPDLDGEPVKGPRWAGWQNFRGGVEAFSVPGNVGLLLGAPSKGLVDIDLDCPEALAASRVFLPSTDMRHGRAGNPGSHWWYQCPGVGKTSRYRDVDNSTLVEIRSTGGQTIVPPSIHKGTGEVIEWEADGDPAGIDAPELIRSVARLAACALLRRHWPEAGARHHTAMALAGMLLRAKWGEDEVIRFIGAVEKRDDFPRAVKDTAKKLIAGEPVTGGGRLRALLSPAVVDLLYEWLELDSDDRPEVRYHPDRKTDALDVVQRAVADRGGVYAFGGRLAVIAGGRITEMNLANMYELVGECVRWRKYSKTEKTWVSVDCPESFHRALFYRTGFKHIPVLDGLVATPTLRADGTLLDRPGYDQTSRLFLGSTRLPGLLKTPSLVDAQTALVKLREPFSEFPFDSPCHESAAISLVLTILVRRGIPSGVPLWLADAPTQGSGKGLCLKICYLMATGQELSFQPLDAREEEEQKNYLSKAMEGRRVIAIDNVEGKFGSPVLAAWITSQVMAGRILGRSETVEVPTPVFCATANNVRVSPDLKRRVLPIRISPFHERPYTRTFERGDLGHWVRARWTEFAGAGLNLLHAYRRAGPARRLARWGSFEAWDWIREAVVWAGGVDPFEANAGFIDQVDDSEDDGWALVLKVWEELFGTEKVSAKLAGEKLGADPRTKGWLESQDKKFAYVLRGMQDKVMDGRGVSKNRSGGRGWVLRRSV